VMKKLGPEAAGQIDWSSPRRNVSGGTRVARAGHPSGA